MSEYIMPPAIFRYIANNMYGCLHLAKNIQHLPMGDK